MKFGTLNIIGSYLPFVNAAGEVLFEAICLKVDKFQKLTLNSETFREPEKKMVFVFLFFIHLSFSPMHIVNLIIVILLQDTSIETHLINVFPYFGKNGHISMVVTKSFSSLLTMRGFIRVKKFHL